MKVRKLVKILLCGTYVNIRRAFDGTVYYRGQIIGIPEDFDYLNRKVLFTIWMDKRGSDLSFNASNIKAHHLDIAISDIDV